MAESDLDQLIAPVYKKYENPATTILAADGDIQIHLRARCATEAEAPTPAGGSRRPDRAAAGRPHLLAQRRSAGSGGRRPAAAQRTPRWRWRKAAPAACWANASPPCPAAPDYFAGGFITYTDAMKTELLGVPAETAGAVRRGEQRDGRSHGRAGAPPHGRHLRALRHRRRRSGPGEDPAVSLPVGTVYVGLADAGGHPFRAPPVPRRPPAHPRLHLPDGARYAPAPSARRHLARPRDSPPLGTATPLFSPSHRVKIVPYVLVLLVLKAPMRGFRVLQAISAAILIAGMGAAGLSVRGPSGSPAVGTPANHRGRRRPYRQSPPDGHPPQFRTSESARGVLAHPG